MHASKYIDELMSHVNQSDVPGTFKERVLSALRYFKNQSLCHGDRRDSQARINQAWLDLESILMGTSLFNKFRRNRNDWTVFLDSLGIEKSPLNVNPPKKKKSRFEDRTAEELLVHLAHRSENKNSFSDMEKALTCIGLYYLQLEASRGRYQRNKERILWTWKLIHPLLKKSGLLDEFDGEADAVKRIKTFISNKFL